MNSETAHSTTRPTSRLAVIAVASFVLLVGLAVALKPQDAAAAINPHLSTDALKESDATIKASLVAPESLEVPQAHVDPEVVEPRKQLPKQINPNSRNRWVLVDVSEQRVYFYQDGVVIKTARVSTGMPGTPTNLGTHRVWSRVYNETMSGPGYYLPGVLYTQYFDSEGEALHYAYWHNKFGTPQSHGCVNMTLADSKYAWDFGFIGMIVKVVQ